MCLWPKCVWPKCVWVLSGRGLSGSVVQVLWLVKVCDQSVCMCVWPKCVQGSRGWVVIWVGGQVGEGSSG